MIVTLLKQPGETLRPVVPFATSAPIAAILATTTVARGLVPGGAPLVAAASVAGGSVTLALVGGADGERYLVTVRARDAAGAELESEVEVTVIDCTWALPDGGAPWLGIAGFVRRFGLDEVVRMTDSDGSGRIDRDLLVDALTDAQAIAMHCRSPACRACWRWRSATSPAPGSIRAARLRASPTRPRQQRDCSNGCRRGKCRWACPPPSRRPPPATRPC